MKILTTIILFFAFSSVVYAQDTVYPSDKTHQQAYNAGEHLKIAANLQFISYASLIVGSGLTTVFVINNQEVPATAFAALTGVATVVPHILSWIHVKKAGKLLQNERISLNIGSRGVGVRLSLN